MVMALAGTLAGCPMWPGQQVAHLPRLPEPWQQFAITLRLTVVDGEDGRERRLPDARPGDAVVLPVGRHTATVVLAEPVILGQPALALRPAGAVVPVSLDSDGVLQVTWERGVLASLVRDLWHGGTNPWLVNLHRLDRELREKAEGAPWALDRTAILAALQENRMRATAIGPLPKHTVSLMLPAGRWVWWDPFAVPLHGDGKSAFQVEATSGYHLLLHDSGGARAVQVTDDGTALISRVTSGSGP